MTSYRKLSSASLRGIDVLEYLSARGTPARASEVARDLGIAISSADQLLKSMVSCGYLIRIPDQRQYFPSPRLMSISAFMNTFYPLGHSFHSIILDVEAATGAVVTLTIQNDCTMQIFDSVTGDFPDGPEPTQGRTFPIFDSVVGAAALTVKPPGEIRRLARCARRQRALPGDRVSLGQLIKNLEPSRRAGYHARGSRHLIDGQHQSDYWSIAMPLPVLAWTCPIVLGVAGPVARIRTREIYIVGLMRQALDRHVRVATDQKVAPLQEACA